MHGCILSTVATDAPVLKHQAINNNSTDYIFIEPVSYNNIIFLENTIRN